MLVLDIGESPSGESYNLVLRSRWEAAGRESELRAATLQDGPDLRVLVLPPLRPEDVLPAESGPEVRVRWLDRRDRLRQRFADLSNDAIEILVRVDPDALPAGTTKDIALLAAAAGDPSLASPGGLDVRSALEIALRMPRQVAEAPDVVNAWNAAAPRQLVDGPVSSPAQAVRAAAGALLVAYPPDASLPDDIESSRDACPSLPLPTDLPPEVLHIADELAAPIVARIDGEQVLERSRGLLRCELDRCIEKPPEGTEADYEARVAERFRPLLDRDDDARRSLAIWKASRIATRGLPFQWDPPSGAGGAYSQLQGVAEWQLRHYQPALQAWRDAKDSEEMPELAKALEDATNAFGRWMRRAWPLIFQNDPPDGGIRPISHKLLDSIRDTSSLSSPTIFLLIDGLSREFEGTVAAIARELRWHIEQQGFGLAWLPPITDVGMFANVAGETPAAALDDDSAYEDRRMTRDRALQQWTQVTGKRLSSIVASRASQIVECLTAEADHYIVVWTHCDYLVHTVRDSELLRVSTETSLRFALRAVARGIASTTRLRSLGPSLRIVLTSDHGWTDFLPLRLVVPNLSDNRGAIQVLRHHLLVEIRGDVPLHRLKAIGEEWMVIEGSTMGVPTAPPRRCYLVPAVAGAPEGTQGMARGHGTLSPQEVIIPFICLRAEHPVFRVPLVEVRCSALRSGEKAEVVVAVRNRCDIDLQKVSVEIPELELRLPSPIVKIAAGAEQEAVASVRPTQSGIIREAAVRASFAGEEHGPTPLALVREIVVEKGERESFGLLAEDNLFERMSTDD